MLLSNFFKLVIQKKRGAQTLTRGTPHGLVAPYHARTMWSKWLHLPCRGPGFDSSVNMTAQS